jgi:hypothetical protein
MQSMFTSLFAFGSNDPNPLNGSSHSPRPFRRARPWLASCLLLVLAGCGGASDSLGDAEQPISAEPNEAGSDSQEQAASEAACAAATNAASCQVVARGLCFDNAEDACACAGCGSDECALAESFPVQAFCPTPGPGSTDPDAPVSNDDGPVSGGTSSSMGQGSNGSSGSVPGSAGCGIDPAHPVPPPEACAGAAEGACDLVVNGQCFVDTELACACAGCALDRCIVLESYPAQVACE